jgi:hypothetical protein
MIELQALPLSPDMVPAALPLLRMADPDLSLDRWNVEARQLIGADSRGAVALLSPGGQLLGLALWREAPKRTLKVGPFVAFELSRHPRSQEALRAALDQLAKRRGCRAVLFDVGDKALTRIN